MNTPKDLTPQQLILMALMHGQPFLRVPTDVSETAEGESAEEESGLMPAAQALDTMEIQFFPSVASDANSQPED